MGMAYYGWVVVVGYVIIRDEGRTLVGNDDGDVLPLAGRAKLLPDRFRLLLNLSMVIYYY